MRLLVLGGTRFLGYHIVDAALARGHRVTTFTRGISATHEHPSVVPLGGDRDPRKGDGLAALAAGTWDAVVDTSGFVPRIVDASASLLADRVGRYLFVSSASVYAGTSKPGTDENAPTQALADPATEDVPTHYGALKAACEAVVERTLGARSMIVRPGLIVGPRDATDRFGYWVARFLHPWLLGDRGPDAVVPAPPEAPIQVIDARDLAAWMVSMLEQGGSGIYNAVSPPGTYTMGSLVGELVHAAHDGGGGPAPVWIDPGTLGASGVAPWTEMPLWLPPGDPEHAGFMLIDAARAHAHGLSERPIADTIADTAGWLVTRDNKNAWKATLTAEREQKILASHAAIAGLRLE